MLGCAKLESVGGQNCAKPDPYRKRSFSVERPIAALAAWRYAYAPEHALVDGRFDAAPPDPKALGPRGRGQRNARSRDEAAWRSSRSPVRRGRGVCRWAAAVWTQQDHPRDRPLAYRHAACGMAHGAGVAARGWRRGLGYRRRPVFELREAEDGARLQQQGDGARSDPRVPPAAAGAWFFVPLGWPDILVGVALFFVGELILSRILFDLKLRDRPY